MRAVHRSARHVLGVMPLENEREGLLRWFVADMQADQAAGLTGSMQGWPTSGGPAGPMHAWYSRLMFGPHAED